MSAAFSSYRNEKHPEFPKVSLTPITVQVALQKTIEMVKQGTQIKLDVRKAKNGSIVMLLMTTDQNACCIIL